MHGNILEWCEDDFYPDYEDAPDDGSAWVESERTSPGRLMRGGSWYSPAWVCRSASRYEITRMYSYNTVGFRVCCDLGGVSSR